MITNGPKFGATERFLKRAAAEGVEFSRDVTKLESSPKWHLSLAGAVAFAAVLVAIVYGARITFHAPPQRDQQSAMQAQQQLEQLTRQNATLDATVSRLQHTLADQQTETESLRAQLATLNVASTSARHDNEQALSAAALSASHSAQSLEQAEAQRKQLEKQLADAGAELAQLNRARASDQAEMVADQVHINELSQQLKTATTNIDMERQLATRRQRRSRSNGRTPVACGGCSRYRS